MSNKKIKNILLSKDEKVESIFSISNSYLILNAIFGVLISFLITFSTDLGILLLLLVFFYFGFYLPRANLYIFTNKRVIIHKGWLSLETSSIDYDKITDIKIRQSAFQRLVLKTGHVTISTAGYLDQDFSMRHIDSPYQVKKTLDEIRS